MWEKTEIPPANPTNVTLDVPPVTPTNVPQATQENLRDKLWFPNVIAQTEWELNNLIKDMKFETFKFFFENWLRNMEPPEKKQIMLWSLLSVLNSKWYSIRLIKNGSVEVFWENEEVLKDEDKKELAKYDTFLKSAIKNKVISIDDIQKAILSKSMATNDFQKELVWNIPMSTTDYFIRVLKEYWLSLKLDTERWLEEADILKKFKDLHFANNEEFESFKNFHLDKITNISDREFVRTYLDSFYYLNWENWYKDEDIKNLQKQVDDNKEELNELFWELPLDVHVKLWLQKEDMIDRISRDPMLALQQWAMNWWIMYAVVFWLLGKIFGWIFWMKHLWNLWLIGWFAVWSWRALWRDWKDMGKILGMMWEWWKDVFNWSKEVLWDWVDYSQETIEKMNFWFNYKDFRINDWNWKKSLENTDFLYLIDKKNTDNLDIKKEDWTNITNEELTKLKEKLVEYETKLKSKYNNQTLESIPEIKGKTLAKIVFLIYNNPNPTPEQNKDTKIDPQSTVIRNFSLVWDNTIWKTNWQTNTQLNWAVNNRTSTVTRNFSL